ncbi:hypothetical protein NBO_419g0013 [Nosema bombycis CQ1]|uniref:Uncharacterized protein n=1 Tax=Nosema bombycis (strain CQ1 / CVCC 102059) TaxID=578461 RepID=R0KPA3_NOSB1|nr:hypothetical protein NBO_419g0013 [Nosema bombycis CQ1]|eukprot:EOB12526.1 hypothetical protein NBO_419g0013 [Nosema bombycis CQ1]
MRFLALFVTILFSVKASEFNRRDIDNSLQFGEDPTSESSKEFFKLLEDQNVKLKKKNDDLMRKTLRLYKEKCENNYFDDDEEGVSKKDDDVKEDCKEENFNYELIHSREVSAEEKLRIFNNHLDRVLSNRYPQKEKDRVEK